MIAHCFYHNICNQRCVTEQTCCKNTLEKFPTTKLTTSMYCICENEKSEKF